MKSDDLINQHSMDALLGCIKSNTYVCDVCGKEIMPDVHLKSDGEIEVTTESSDIRGAYNKRLGKVCKECIKAMSLPSNSELSYKFGDILNYKSPQNNSKTKCLFVRKEGNKAVVMFENAEFSARVGYHQLEKHNEW